MVEIIPAINEARWETVKHHIELIAPYSDWVEVDVSDGEFASTTTWNRPEDLKTLATKHVRIAVHFMMYEPGRVIPSWIGAGVRRIFVHYEAMRRSGMKAFFGIDGTETEIKKLADLCHRSWVEFGLAIVRQTPVAAIQKYLPLVDLVQVLAVDPGPSGQQLHREAFSRVSELRSLQGKFKIEWDGGVNLANVKEIKRAGADIIAATSAIFGSQEPQKALEALKRELLG